eukprot:Gb_30287 [translate_table: standard]
MPSLSPSKSFASISSMESISVSQYFATSVSRRHFIFLQTASFRPATTTVHFSQALGLAYATSHLKPSGNHGIHSMTKTPSSVRDFFHGDFFKFLRLLLDQCFSFSA